MPRDFYPRRQADILNFTANLSQKINADPAGYFVSPQRAADYAIVQSSFAAAYRTAHDPDTNSSTASVVKREAAMVLETETRELLRPIRANPDIPVLLKSQLGLNAPKRTRTRINRPDAPPAIRIVSVAGNRIKVQLTEALTGRRGKPKHVRAANVFFHVGDDAPPSRDGWSFAGAKSRVSFELSMPPTVPAGAKVWVVACWTNPRGQAGPNCMPVSTHIGFAPSLAISRKAA